MQTEATNIRHFLSSARQDASAVAAKKTHTRQLTAFVLVSSEQSQVR